MYPPPRNGKRPATTAGLTGVTVPRRRAARPAHHPHHRPSTSHQPTHRAPPDPLPLGIEGRISHLKRRYGMRRTRLKGHQGARTWVGWAILTYNLDILAIRTT